MTKFIKTLIIINGILIPAVLLIILVSFLISQFSHQSNYTPDPVMTENLITKDGDTLLAQGLLYYSPESIYNSTNLMIRVKPKTFKTPKSLYSGKNRYDGTANCIMEAPSDFCVNVLFLDSGYNLMTRLVDRKAFIESIIIPSGNEYEKVDTTVKNIAYLIAFEDTNNDKLIDCDDKSDLFISDLGGRNLTRVSDNIDINDVKFINMHKELFISFTDRDDNIAEEHRIKRFAIYNIESKKLRVLTQIDKALNEVQNILIRQNGK